jgi:hypothetical protein
MRALKPGDILIRYLMPFSVWHYGIVIKVLDQNLDNILLFEFADADKVTRVSLRDFMYGRIYFWIDDFAFERENYGDEVFFSIEERIARAYKIAKKGGMYYTINKYNCEYFTRKCVFKNKELWPSKQTSNIGETKFSIYAKIGLLFTYGILKNHTDTTKWESRLNPTPFKYVVCIKCGQINSGANVNKFEYFQCDCKNKFKLH